MMKCILATFLVMGTLAVGAAAQETKAAPQEKAAAQTRKLKLEDVPPEDHSG
jgi:hypothetical protein